MSRHSTPAFSLHGDQIPGTHPVQEDSFGTQTVSGDEAASASGYIVVADGVGGEPDGDLASREVVRATLAALGQRPGSMCDVARIANYHMAEAKKAGLMDREACTTLLAVSYGDGGISWISSGDSLLLLWDAHERLQILNKRHIQGLYLQEQLQKKQITREEYDQVPPEEMEAIYSCISGEPIRFLDVGEHMLTPGDRVLAASDGILSLDRKELTSVLRQCAGKSPKQTVNTILKAVQQKNLPDQDNTTLVVLDYGKKDTTPSRVAADITPVEPDPDRNIYAASLLGDASRQEDSIWHVSDRQAALAIVADGAGGHVGGNLASQIAVREAKKLWESDLCHGVDAEKATGPLTRYLQETSVLVRKEAVQPGAPDSGKSAVVLLYINGDTACVAHAGDCRAYVRHASGAWEQWTEDDSILQVGLRAKLISPQDAWQHPDQNRLTQALGVKDELTPHVSVHKISPKDTFLLCCDGFWNQLRPEIWQKESTAADKLPGLPERWAKMAVEAKPAKSDNVSLILVGAVSAGNYGLGPNIPTTDGRGSHRTGLYMAVLLLLALAAWACSVLFR